MPDIFISYASPDREIAQTIADALGQRGHSVWWDRTIPPGRVFDEVIQEALNAAKCVIVLWSANSIRSNWVKTEASEALALNRLVPVLIEDVHPPIEFKRIQAAYLVGWTGDTRHPEFAGMIASVERLITQPGTTPSVSTAAPKSLRRPSGTITISTRSAIRAVAAFGAFAAVIAGVLYLRSGDESTSGARGAPVVDAARATAGAQQPSTASRDSSAPGGGSGARASSGDRINLLAAENGGELLTAPDSTWTRMIDGDESSSGWIDFSNVGKNEATIGFKDGRTATFDTVAVRIGGRDDRNVRQFELLVGNDGPLGSFRSVGVFTTQNILIVKSPYQSFTFDPVTARVVKIRPLSTHGGNNAMTISELQLLGRLN
jgi:hypothetical protein